MISVWSSPIKNKYYVVFGLVRLKHILCSFWYSMNHRTWHLLNPKFVGTRTAADANWRRDSRTPAFSSDHLARGSLLLLLLMLLLLILISEKQLSG